MSNPFLLLRDGFSELEGKQKENGKATKIESLKPPTNVTNPLELIKLVYSLHMDERDSD